MELSTNRVEELMNYFSERKVKGISSSEYYGLRSMKSMKSLRHIRDGRQKATKSDLEPNRNVQESHQQQPEDCYYNKGDMNNRESQLSERQLRGQSMVVQHEQYTQLSSINPLQSEVNTLHGQPDSKPFKRPSNVKVVKNRNSLLNFPNNSQHQPQLNNDSLLHMHQPPINSYNELNNVDFSLLQGSLKSVESMTNLNTQQRLATANEKASQPSKVSLQRPSV